MTEREKWRIQLNENLIKNLVNKTSKNYVEDSIEPIIKDYEKEIYALKKRNEELENNECTMFCCHISEARKEFGEKILDGVFENPSLDKSVWKEIRDIIERIRNGNN